MSIKKKIILIVSSSTIASAHVRMIVSHHFMPQSYSLLLFLIVVSYELEEDVDVDMRDELQSRLLRRLSTSDKVDFSDKISSCCSRTCRSKS